MQPVILVINPNTSEQMTQTIRESARQAALGCEVVTRRAATGPETIETPLDAALSVPGMVETALAEPKAFDAIVSACFDDPALDILRRVFDVPVVGIAESALSLAATFPGDFSILVTQPDSIGETEAYVRRKGYGDRLHTVAALGMSVRDAEHGDDKTTEKIVSTGRGLLNAKAPTLILGCAGLGKYAGRIADASQRCCIDPVAAGVRLAAAAALMRGRLAGAAKPARHARALKPLKGYPGLQSLYGPCEGL